MKPHSTTSITRCEFLLMILFGVIVWNNAFSGTHTRHFVSSFNAYSTAQTGCTFSNVTATFNVSNCSTSAAGNSNISQTYSVTWYYSTTNTSNNAGTGALGSISGGNLQSCGNGTTWTVTLPSASVVAPPNGVTYYYYCVLSNAAFSSGSNNCTTGIATFPFTGSSTTSLSGSAPLGGTVTVGTSGANFTSLTGINGLFERINNCGLSSNLTVNITSNLTETGTNALNQWSGAYTLKIQPGSTGLKTISGNVSDELIRLNGADNVTIDGRYNGSGQHLKFTNTNVNFAVISAENSSANNTFQYILIENGYNGINLIDNTVSGTTIDHCSIYDFQQVGIYLNGTSTISNNAIYSTSIKSGSVAGIYIINSSSAAVRNNNVYDLFPAVGSAGFGIYYFGASGASNSAFISNNFVNLGRNISSGNQLGGIHYAGYIANSIYLYYNTVYIQGSASSGTTYALAKTQAANVFDARNNLLINLRTVSGNYQYANYYTNINATVFTSDYNDHYVSNFANNGITSAYNNILGIPLGYTFTNYKTVSGKDANSASVAPSFASSSNLHINTTGNTAIIDKGVAIAGFTTDYDYESRTATIPDIGADEIVITPLPVQLLHFSVECAEEKSTERMVYWSTASESNSSYFNIERSRNSEQWEVIASIAAAGNSSSELQYSHEINDLQDGLLYFRLVQYDQNGENTAYDPVSSDCLETFELTSDKLITYPNPSSGSEIKISLHTSNFNETGHLSIFTTSGQLVFENKIQISKGTNEYFISEPLQSGLYFIQIRDGEHLPVSTTHVVY
jgi:hypothetical protein